MTYESLPPDMAHRIRSPSAMSPNSSIARPTLWARLLSRPPRETAPETPRRRGVSMVRSWGIDGPPRWLSAPDGPFGARHYILVVRPVFSPAGGPLMHTRGLFDTPCPICYKPRRHGADVPPAGAAPVA